MSRARRVPWRCTECESLLCKEQILWLGTHWMSSLLPAWYSRTLHTRWLFKSDCSDKGTSFTTSDSITCCCFWSYNYSTLSGSMRNVGWLAFFLICQMCDKAVGCDGREKAKICLCSIFQWLSVFSVMQVILLWKGETEAVGLSLLSWQSSHEFSSITEFDFMCFYFFNQPHRS